MQLTRLTVCDLRTPRYTHTWGQFKQDGFRQALQTPPDTEAASLKEVDLIAWEGKQPVTYALRDGSREPLRLTFWATQESVNSLSDWCKWFESSTSLPQHPYPVLIPSKGRAKAAHLNWRAPHCFGPAAFQSDGQRQSPSALVVAVVEPSEAKEYREAWADLPLLVLPENDMGPAFVRWCIQKVSSAFRMEQCHELGALQQMRYCWLVDDSITSFYRLNPLSDQSLQEEDERLQSRGIVVPATSLSKPAGRKSERRCHGAMFAEAMLAVQQQASQGTCAICGFLRDDGTAPMKSAQWALDSTSVFKVVLLNLVELAKLQVEYLPQLHLFEDVCLNVQARNSGGRILKCLRYCYWADNKTFGGCAEQRAQKAAAPRCLLDCIEWLSCMLRTQTDRKIRSKEQGWQIAFRVCLARKSSLLVASGKPQTCKCHRKLPKQMPELVLSPVAPCNRQHHPKLFHGPPKAVRIVLIWPCPRSLSLFTSRPHQWLQ